MDSEQFLFVVPHQLHGAGITKVACRSCVRVIHDTLHLRRGSSYRSNAAV